MVDALTQICDLLRSPLVETLFTSHPNDLCQLYPPSEWRDWWTWAGELTAPSEDDTLCDWKWQLLLKYHTKPNDSGSHENLAAIPGELRALVDAARRLQYVRQPGPTTLCLDSLGRANVFPSAVLTPSCQQPLNHDEPPTESFKEPRLRDMSPKKSHEVSCMTEYISRLLSSSPELRQIKHVVDVGAGQAYLSRKLRDDLGLHVLALDWSEIQEKGAARKEWASNGGKVKWPKNVARVPDPYVTDPSTGGPGRNGSLTYRTLMITPDTLLEAVDNWVSHSSRPDVLTSAETIPVLFVALHACGSLTLDILRAMLARIQATGHRRTWVPQAAVLVGCCYNRLDPGDFPLSEDLIASENGDSRVTLNHDHLQLAAQVPSQWLRDEAALRAAALAAKKVAWRALLAGVLTKRSPMDFSVDSSDRDDERPDGVNFSPKIQRLGRLNDASYTDWQTFLSRAAQKLDLDLGRDNPRDLAMESRIKVYHVLRCLVGPVVETLMLLDRQLWIRKELEDTGLGLQLVNLFDQAAGSSRNVAIVLKPGPHDSQIPWP